MKTKFAKGFAFAAFALIAGLIFAPERAEAATVTVDTRYGERTINEPDYEKFWLVGNTKDTGVIFYNGDLTLSVSSSGTIFTATGNAKVYAPDADYVPVEYAAGENLPGELIDQKYAVISAYDSYHYIYTPGSGDPVENDYPSITTFYTKKEIGEFTKSVLDDVDFETQGNAYYTISCEGYCFVRVELNDTSVQWYDIEDGLVEDSGAIAVCEQAWTVVTTKEIGARETVIFSSNDVSGTENSTPYTVPSVHGDVRTAAFDVFAGMTQVDIDVEPTVVCVRVPLNVAVSINVNVDDALVYADIVVENETKAPVKLSIANFTSNDLPFTDLIAPDELPDSLEWETLGAEDSQKYFALGVKAIDAENDPWKSIAGDYAWAVPGFTETELGVIQAESSSNLGLDARFGRVQSEGNSFSFAVTFVAELE